VRLWLLWLKLLLLLLLLWGLLWRAGGSMVVFFGCLCCMQAFAW